MHLVFIQMTGFANAPAKATKCWVSIVRTLHLKKKKKKNTLCFSLDKNLIKADRRGHQGSGLLHCNQLQPRLPQPRSSLPNVHCPMFNVTSSLSAPCAIHGMCWLGFGSKYYPLPLQFGLLSPTRPVGCNTWGGDVLTLAFANKNQSLQFGNQKNTRFR